MQFYITMDEGGFLRITDENDNAVTLYYSEGVASILSIFVAEDERGEGLGRGLIAAAEVLCAHRGVTLIEADYADIMPEVTSFFAKNGYSICEGSPVISVAMSEIIANEAVKKTLQRSFSGLRFVSLEEILLMQWEEVSSVFLKFSMRLSKDELGRFSQKLSGLVYDKASEAQALILCSTKGSGLHVDFIGTSGGDSQQYAVAALQGVLLEAIAEGGELKYPAITAFCVQDNVEKALANIGLSTESLLKSVYAKKEISEDDHDMDSFDIDSEPEDQMNEWIGEINSVSMQSNICWKAAWHRRYEERQNGVFRGRAAEDIPEGKNGGTPETDKPVSKNLQAENVLWEKEMKSRYEAEPSDVIVSVKEISGLPFVGKTAPDYVMSLGDISERQFMRGMGNCILLRRMGLIEDPLNIAKDDFECEVSSCLITDSRVSGFLLLHTEAEGLLMVDLLFASGPDAQSDILKLMIRTIKVLCENYPEDTGVILRRHNEAARKLVSRLFPQKAGKEGR